MSFSPNSQQLASGSGDTTVRFWDINTELPWKTGEGGHTNWVLIVSWSPDGKKLATGAMDNSICIWNAENGT